MTPFTSDGCADTRAGAGRHQTRARGTVLSPALLLQFISRPRVVTFGLHSAPVAPGIMHEFKFHPLGIGEKNRVVIFSILRILGGSVEHLDPFAHEKVVERIDVGARARSQREMM